MFCKLSKIAVAVLFVTCMSTMVFSQQLEVHSSGIMLKPTGSIYPLQVWDYYGDPSLIPGSPCWGFLGTYENPFYWTWSVFGTFYDINYYGNLNQLSDSSEKENITNLESVLSKIMNVRPIRYDYKPNLKMSERARKKSDNKNKIGFLAQELQNQFPEMVKLDSATGKKGVNYIEMIPVLLKAVQELKTIVDRQDSTIANLTRKIETK